MSVNKKIATRRLARRQTVSEAKDGLRILAAFAILLALVSVPVFSTILPPLVDYPNHLSRMAVLATGGTAYFQPNWSLLPNLAEDSVVPFLSLFVSLDLAGKLFLVAIFALTAGGTLWLNRTATGRWHFWPLLAFLMVYNRSFLWGFLNYSAGAGLALCGLALWLALEKSALFIRIGVSSLIAVACYFSHIEALAVYAITICGLEALPAFDMAKREDWAGLRRRSLVAGIPFVLPIIAYFAAWHGSQGMGWTFTGYGRKADLLFSVFDNYNRPFDVVCFVLFVGALIVMFVRRSIVPSPRVMAAACLLFVAYLVIPSQLLSGSGADHRLPPMIFLLVIAAGTPNFVKFRSASSLIFAALLLFALRWTVIERVWVQADRIYRADISVLDQIPKGAKLAVAFPPEATNMVPVPLLHLPTLAIERRAAFVPTLFAFPTQQPIRLTPQAEALMVMTPEGLWEGLMQSVQTRFDTEKKLSGYDYLIALNRRSFDWKEDPCFRPLSLSPDFKLFWIDHAACDEKMSQNTSDNKIDAPN